MRNTTSPGRWLAGHYDEDGVLREVAVFPYYERAAMYLDMLRLENDGRGEYKMKLMRER